MNSDFRGEDEMGEFGSTTTLLTSSLFTSFRSSRNDWKNLLRFPLTLSTPPTILTKRKAPLPAQDEKNEFQFEPSCDDVDKCACLSRKNSYTINDDNCNNRNEDSLSNLENNDETSTCVRAGHYNLVKFSDVPAYLQFNQYILTGYRPPNLSLLDCIKSLAYLHNETVNILTHVISVFIFGVLMPSLIPWNEIRHPLLAYTVIIGSISSWVGSSVYHLFMNYEGGEKFYTTLLQWDVTGIWVTQAVGAATTIYTSVALYDDWVRILLISTYTILSLFALRDSILARSAWSRILGFGSLFLVRMVAFALRLAAVDSANGEGSPLIHIVAQEVIPIIGSLMSATRVPERWFPGRLDYGFNSHNLMHVLVVVGAFHMHAGARADLLWLARLENERMTTSPPGGMQSLLYYSPKWF